MRRPSCPRRLRARSAAPTAAVPSASGRESPRTPTSVTAAAARITPPIPHAALMCAEALLAPVEQVEREHREEHEQRPGDERLGRHHRDDQARPRVGDDRTRAGADHVQHPLRLGRRDLPGLGRRRRADPRQEQRRPQERPRGDRKQDPGPAHGDDDPAEGRAGEGPGALDRARGDVRSRQLVRRPGERGAPGCAAAACAAPRGGPGVALLPSLARTPEELTAANVASSTIESVGAFAGRPWAGS